MDLNGGNSAGSARQGHRAFGRPMAQVRALDDRVELAQPRAFTPSRLHAFNGSMSPRSNSCWRTSFFVIFPYPDFGNASQKNTLRGHR